LKSSMESTINSKLDFIKLIVKSRGSFNKMIDFDFHIHFLFLYILPLYPLYSNHFSSSVLKYISLPLQNMPIFSSH
jgi:hypothetical protein